MRVPPRTTSRQRASRYPARIGSTRQAIPTGVSLQRLLKPSIKPSPESDSIFVPPSPDAAGSCLKGQAGGPGASIGGAGTSAGGSGTSVIAPDPGTSEPGSGTAVVVPGTTPAPQAAVDSSISQP